MTRDEAAELAERLGREHPDRKTHAWLLRQDDSGWSIVKVPRVSGVDEPLSEATAERPKPPHPDDPRPVEWQNISPF